VHAAMVLDDCMVGSLTEERLRRVLGPKMGGAWNLHCQTRQAPLDHFVLFSSMSSVVGTRGQANYCAANTFLDTLSHHRRALGLPGLTINWGFLGEVGYVARNDKVLNMFEAAGVRSFTPGQALTLLGHCLAGALPTVGVVRANWKVLGTSLMVGRASP